MLLLSVPVLVLLTGCPGKHKKEIVIIHQNAADFASTPYYLPPHGGIGAPIPECQDYQRQAPASHGFYDPVKEEWVYPTTIDRGSRDAWERCQQARAIWKGRFSPTTYERVESLLLQISRPMQNHERARIVWLELGITETELGDCLRTRTLSVSLIVKIQKRFDCSYDEAQALGRYILLSERS